MAEQKQYDLVVIGSGPGGYIGAIRAAQLGFKVAVVEKDKTFGGTCLNVGCIPSKALLDSSEHYSSAKHDLGKHGVKLTGVDLDLKTMLGRKDKIVGELTQGIAFLFRKNRIDGHQGTGKIINAKEVEVTPATGGAFRIGTKYIMLATGSVPVELKSMKFDGKKIVSSTEALSFPEVPKRLAIIGGGVIGLELGSVWARLGSQVTVFEFTDHIAGSMDLGLSKMLKGILEKQGFEFKLNTLVTRVDVLPKGAAVFYSSRTDQATSSLQADVVLVAVGRRPFSDGLGLEQVGVKKDEAGRVIVDDHFQTNVPGIYAIGDLIRGPMLAHKAEEEGVAVAEILAGQPGHVNYETVPGVIYTWPEFASVGATEEQLKERGVNYKVGTFPFLANGRAKALGFTDGQVKILAESKTDRVLGVHILGPRASDMIAEAAVAMEFGASSEDIARSFHAHPTLAEVVREAALAVDKRARQM